MRQCTFVLSVVALVFLFGAWMASPDVAEAAGRFGTRICWDGGCSYRPVPGAAKREATIKAALKTVFAEELQRHPTLQTFLDGSKAGQPYTLAGQEWASLEK